MDEPHDYESGRRSLEGGHGHRRGPPAGSHLPMEARGAPEAHRRAAARHRHEQRPGVCERLLRCLCCFGRQHHPSPARNSQQQLLRQGNSCDSSSSRSESPRLLLLPEEASGHELSYSAPPSGGCAATTPAPQPPLPPLPPQPPPRLPPPPPPHLSATVPTVAESLRKVPTAPSLFHALHSEGRAFTISQQHLAHQRSRSVGSVQLFHEARSPAHPPQMPASAVPRHHRTSSMEAPPTHTLLLNFDDDAPLFTPPSPQPLPQPAAPAPVVAGMPKWEQPEWKAKGEEEELCCPTCLEEYTDDNPLILTECKHHFHLGCIYEWMERSSRCPVCDREMIFDEGFG